MVVLKVKTKVIKTFTANPTRQIVILEKVSVKTFKLPLFCLIPTS